MGNIVGKPFGVVASKDYNTALTESVKEGNQAKFYLAENGGNGFNDITATTDDSRNTLIVNGNKIQGVSTSDINKLNLISGSGLITDGAFKYKGSVNKFSNLPSSPDNVSIGDVYNINNQFTIDGILYPAYTSVVCIGTNGDGFSPIEWNALGGTMYIGTNVTPKQLSIYELVYNHNDRTPISSFTIKLKQKSGLTFNYDEIKLNLGKGLMLDGDNITISTGAGLDFNINGQLGLKLGTRCSGLYFDSSYGLNVALATDIYNTNSYISGIVILGKQDASYGGLAIDSNALSDWLENDATVENHIISIARNNLRLGSGLTNSQENDIQLNLGRCLFINDSDQIDISVGSGLINQNGSVEVSAGRGLSINPDDKKLQVSIGSGLYFNDNAVKINAKEELQVFNDSLLLNVDYLSGTEKDNNLFYYSKGGLYFANTIKSGQRDKNVLTDTSIYNRKTYLQLRCGTGLAFQEGYQDLPGVDSNSSQILGHDGKYYVNIDNTTIELNTNSKLRVKHDSTLSESSNGLSVKVGNNLAIDDDGININLPVPTPSDLQVLPVSTAGILVNDGNNGLCVDIPALKRLVELIMAAK